MVFLIMIFYGNGCFLKNAYWVKGFADPALCLLYRVMDYPRSLVVKFDTDYLS